MSKMSLCNVEVIKIIGKYLNTSVGPVCYNTDKVLTTVLDKQNVEGFASIILRLVSKSSVKLSQRQILLCYQWLEHLAMYADQAVSNLTFARSFLKDVNKALEKNTYLTGQFLTVADVAAYHVLYPILERLSVSEREGLLHICRWSKHVQCQPKCSHETHRTINVPLPTQIFPHQLRAKDKEFDKKNQNVHIIYHPQPFSFPKYPVILYIPTN